MAKSAAGKLGSKYGSKVEDFAKSSENAIEAVAMAWANDVAIPAMRNVIVRKARTGQASTLAQSMTPKFVTERGGISIQVVTTETYSDYVDKGVKGTRFNKAPKSPYKFKNLGVPKAMKDSFKAYIAATGLKVLKNPTGKATKLLHKDKKKQADVIDTAAQQLAVATKIGGIKPMNFKAAATTPKSMSNLKKAMSKALGEAIKLNLIST